MRLLVVEDDRALAVVLRRGLSEEGYAVDVAGTVAAAHEAAWINEYDVVILDLGLPDGSGLSLCRRLRAERHPAKVLMLTARDSVEEKVMGLDAGADDYLTKPFAFPELTARVRALLRRPEQTLSPVLELDGVRLDPAAHKVWCNEVELAVTPREFTVLHHLISRSGLVVTRTELLEHAWDAAYDGFSNVVEVHVTSVRRKLEAAGSRPTIETVRGVGYRFNAAGNQRQIDRIPDAKGVAR